ncbi:MAG: hypothetical protein ACYDA3_09715 [Gaiellaceae bacterium]
MGTAVSSGDNRDAGRGDVREHWRTSGRYNLSSGPSVRPDKLGVVVGEELRRLSTWQERHRRLLARLIIVFGLTVVVDLVSAFFVWNWESGLKGGDIHGFRDSLFFVTVQVLTVSSSIKNPLTGIGKVVDVMLELWAIGVVTAVAGSFSTFFISGDS